MSEQEVITCPRHPKTVTYLRCGSCNIPICPDCSVQTPVGFKCKDCGTYKNVALFNASPLQMLCGFLVGLAAGVLAGLILPLIGFYSIFVAMIYGRFAGTIIQRASGHKLGLPMEIITGASIIIGAVGPHAVLMLLFMQVQTAVVRAHPHTPAPVHGMDPLTMVFLGSGFGIYALIVAVVVAAAAVSTYRFTWKSW